jgi:hypothetical protein
MLSAAVSSRQSPTQKYRYRRINQKTTQRRFAENSINPILGDVIKKINDKFAPEMAADGIDIAKLTPGRGKPKESPWKIVYRWLRMRWIWQSLVEKATSIVSGLIFCIQKPSWTCHPAAASETTASS